MNTILKKLIERLSSLSQKLETQAAFTDKLWAVVDKDGHQQSFMFEFNNFNSFLKQFKKAKKKVAAVIIEPMNIIEPDKIFLKKIVTNINPEKAKIGIYISGENIISVIEGTSEF